MVSADTKISPCIEKIFTKYAFSEDFSTGKIFPENHGIHDKASIFNVLRTFVKDPEEYINSVKGSRINIFELNIFLTA